MIHKLPRWVELGGFVLSWNAGFINAVGLLGFKHQGVSHMTGTATFLSLSIANWQLMDALHLLLVIASFVLGAACSGFITGNSALKLGRPYSRALLLESALLLVALLLLQQDSAVGDYFTSAACGLQNAMTTTYSGAVVRTTHVSGLFTDLGLSLGLRLRGHKTDRRRLILYATLIVGFTSGAVIGALGFMRYVFAALWLPFGLTLLTGLVYGTYIRIIRGRGRSLGA